MADPGEAIRRCGRGIAMGMGVPWENAGTAAGKTWERLSDFRITGP